MSTAPKSSSKRDPSDDDGALALLGKYWFPILLSILAVIFIVQNTGEIRVQLFGWRAYSPAWVIFAIMLVVGWVLGWFSHRRRIKRRTGL